MKNIIELLESLDGVLKVCQLNPDNVLNLIDIESQRGAELVPVFNKGIQECFKRDVTFVILKKVFSDLLQHQQCF